MTKRAMLELSREAEAPLPTQRFANVGDVCENEDGSSMLEITIKFSTNITSTNHDSRTMFWRAELELNTPSDNVLRQCDSPAFGYHPREPKIGDSARVDLVLCDGRPGDLLILHGERLGSVHQELRCRISRAGKHHTLSREVVQSSTTSSCFTARLPLDLLSGPATLCMTIDEAVVSNQQPLTILPRRSNPALPLHALPVCRQAFTPTQDCDVEVEEELLETGGPICNKSHRSQNRHARRKAVSPTHSEDHLRPRAPRAPSADISLIQAPSQWHLPGFHYTPQSGIPLSRQSSEEMCQRLTSWFAENQGAVTSTTCAQSFPMSRSGSSELCRNMSLSLGRANSEDWLLAAGSVF